ncbi:c-type cytochrome [Lacibacter sediminis]|uniref:Cytochrome c n=1 Tax=Lacibacter sediminis TaxID=2760713 RepID=A0A7G5XBS2_9BACT|nr:cytochrome c [Lacibacter sediminis]QNA42925.1 cytochrome c [Lacibacter sediminis]
MKKISIVLFIAVTAFAFTNQQPDMKASMQRGKKVYETHCLSCHQPDGKGLPRMNPPLVKTKQVLGNKTQLINIILNGLDEELVINGETYFNPMPSQPYLKDQEIADVLTYVRNSFGNKASLVTTAEVKAARAKIK